MEKFGASFRAFFALPSDFPLKLEDAFRFFSMATLLVAIFASLVAEGSEIFQNMAIFED